MINLTYVSDCRIAADALAAEIGAIVACATERNAQDRITGVLLFTGTRFVQTLEGAAGDVDRLMKRIESDDRHAMLLVIDRHAVAVRNFPRWSLSYAGPSLFVAAAVARALGGFRADARPDVARLLRMMVEFGAPLPFSAP